MVYIVSFFRLCSSIQANVPEDTPAALWNLLVDCAAQNAAKRPTFPEIVKRLKDIKVDGDGEKSDAGDSDSSSDDDDGGELFLLTICLFCSTTYFNRRFL
jgi:hypothetical protein